MQDTEQNLLTAAERIFKSGTPDPFDGISYRQIAREACYSEATVRKYFPTRDVFASRFVEHLLRSDATSTYQRPLNEISNQLRDRSCKIFGVVSRLSELAIDGSLVGHDLHVQVKLWDLVDRMPFVRDHVVRQLRTSDHSLEITLNRFFSDHADILRRRATWLSAPELAAILGAFFDGLSMRSKLGSLSVSPETVAKVVAVLLMAAIEVDDDDTNTILEQLEKVDAYRSRTCVPLNA